MKEVKIALARFYNAKFVELPETEEIRWEHGYGGVKVTARLSRTTSFTNWGAPTLLLSKGNEAKDIYPLVYPGPDKFPADIYFEVIAYKHLPVEDDIAIALESGDINAQRELFKEFRDHEYNLRKAIDYCAGMLGLRVHPELVAIPIFEVDHCYLFINDNNYFFEGGIVVNFKGTVKINHTGAGTILHSTGNIQLNSTDPLAKSTECLTWLLRGWSVDDYVLRFLTFFTALECILPGFTSIESKAFHKMRNKIVDLIKQSTLSPDLDEKEFDNFLFKNPPSPPLTSRFDKMAEESSLPDSEKDKTDFKKYCIIRNALLHRGDRTLDKHPHIDNEILKQFEQLVQKYVRYILYGSNKKITPNKSSKSIVKIMGKYKGILL
jgi:hypothetical protein